MVSYVSYQLIWNNVVFCNRRHLILTEFICNYFQFFIRKVLLLFLKGRGEPLKLQVQSVLQLPSTHSLFLLSSLHLFYSKMKTTPARGGKLWKHLAPLGQLRPWEMHWAPSEVYTGPRCRHLGCATAQHQHRCPQRHQGKRQLSQRNSEEQEIALKCKSSHTSFHH